MIIIGIHLSYILENIKNDEIVMKGQNKVHTFGDGIYYEDIEIIREYEEEGMICLCLIRVRC
jgi:hypothetical protein